MNVKGLILPVLAICALAGMTAQQQTVSVPVADGSLSANEYRISGTYGGMNLGVTLADDGKTLYVALEVPSTGWVSVGLGSKKMDGAFIVIASDNSGVTVISEETGKGHGHKPNATKILIAQAVKELGGKTVLEFAIPSSAFIKGGNLDLILAYGGKDSLNSFHKKYDKVSLKL
jgi:hypothetical protein